MKNDHHTVQTSTHPTKKKKKKKKKKTKKHTARYFRLAYCLSVTIAVNKIVSIRMKYGLHLFAVTRVTANKCRPYFIRIETFATFDFEPSLIYRLISGFHSDRIR